LRATPDFPDEARPLIGPRFGSGFGWGAVRCWRAEQGGALASAARRNDLRSPTARGAGSINSRSPSRHLWLEVELIGAAGGLPIDAGPPVAGVAERRFGLLIRDGG